jgi:hypothetical protein
MAKFYLAATFRTCIWEVPGSNLDQGTGYKVISQGLMNLHSPFRKKIYIPQSKQPVSSKFFHFFIHQPYTLSIILNLGNTA